MTLLVNRHRETALRLLDEPAPWQVIRMSAGTLVFSALHADEIAAEKWREINYPVYKAIQAFLSHRAGVSEPVRVALTQALFF